MKRPSLTELDKRLTLVEQKQAAQESVLMKLDVSVDKLAETIAQLATQNARFSGAFFVVTPILAFLGTLFAQKVFA